MYTAQWEAEWERVLWKKKSYPDNYVPRSFLSSLSRNRELLLLDLHPLSHCVMASQLSAIYLLAPRYPIVPHKPAPCQYIRLPRRFLEASTEDTGSTCPRVDIRRRILCRLYCMGTIGMQFGP